MTNACRLLGAAIAALFICGCASEAERVESSGVPAEPPNGWLVWCAEFPHDPSCPTEKRL
jgi:hypothetical protein